MVDISSVSEELDDLIYELITTDDEAKPIAEDLLATSLEYDSVVQAEVIETITDATGYNKTTVEDWKAELEERRALDLLTIESITKVERWGPTEPLLYEFTVSIPSHDAPQTFRISSENLMSSAAFERRVLELTDTLVQYDDWDDVLNTWLREHEIQTTMEDPLESEHAVTEAVIDRIRAMELVTSRASFRTNPDTIYVDPEEDLAGVTGTVIDSATREVQGETDPRKIRAILKPLMKSEDAAMIRTNSGRKRIWRFSLSELDEENIIDPEPILDDTDGES